MGALLAKVERVKMQGAAEAVAVVVPEMEARPSLGLQRQVASEAEAMKM